MEGRILYICSDWHWGHPNCCYTGIEKLIELAEQENAVIMLVGDTLDCWYRAADELQNEYGKLLRRIQKRLLFNIVGNHDGPILHKHSLLRPAHYPEKTFVVDERVWFCTHGHLFGNWKRLFEFLDRWDEKWWFRKIARFMVKRTFLGESGRHWSDPGYKLAILRRAMFCGATVAVAGHNHFQEVREVEAGNLKMTYINPGSALGNSVGYIRYENGNFEIKRAS